MKIILEFKQNCYNLYNLMRDCGYHYQGTNEKTGEVSFIRRAGFGDYPRFHVYIKTEKEQIIINLHLDQKKPVYQGASAHSAEYDGKIVANEATRIKQASGP